MADSSFSPRVHPALPALRRRHVFSIGTVAATVGLIGWGGFVTSINAGLAVPDWPSSFNSYDPFNPWPAWWTLTPVLAEHGHRLLGALVGLLTAILAVWTWQADARPWMRRLGFFALGLVIAQGMLGGLRVVWVSLDLAVVHACAAQLFFATVVALAVFTSPAWVSGPTRLPAFEQTGLLRRLAGLTVAVLYGQIILGALLRHPGTGIDPALVLLHALGATVVLGLVAATVHVVLTRYRAYGVLRRGALLLAGLVALQILLGLTAYLVLLDERGLLQPSNVQVIVNTTHLVVGALLFGASVALALWANRRPPPAVGEALPGEPVAHEEQRATARVETPLF